MSNFSFLISLPVLDRRFSTINNILVVNYYLAPKLDAIVAVGTPCIHAGTVLLKSILDLLDLKIITEFNNLFCFFFTAAKIALS